MGPSQRSGQILKPDFVGASAFGQSAKVIAGNCTVRDALISINDVQANVPLSPVRYR